MGVHAAATTGCEHGRSSKEGPLSNTFNVSANTDASTLINQQVRCERVLVNGDVVVSANRFRYRTFDFPSRLIEVVHDSVAAMPSFHAKTYFTFFGVEANANIE